MAQAFTVPEDPGSSSTSRDDVNELRRVPLAALKVDETVQQRVGGTAKKVVAEYAEAMRNGAKFPPATVFSSDGLTFILADGFHRIAAHRLAHPDTPEIECETLARIIQPIDPLVAQAGVLA